MNPGSVHVPRPHKGRGSCTGQRRYGYPGTGQNGRGGSQRAAVRGPWARATTPRVATWLSPGRPMLEAAISACRRRGGILVAVNNRLVPRPEVGVRLTAPTASARHLLLEHDGSRTVTEGPLGDLGGGDVIQL